LPEADRSAPRFCICRIARFDDGHIFENGRHAALFELFAHVEPILFSVFENDGKPFDRFFRKIIIAVFLHGRSVRSGNVKLLICDGKRHFLSYDRFDFDLLRRAV